MARERFTKEEKLAMVISELRGKKSAADICRDYGINRTLFNRWRNSFIDAGSRAFLEKGSIKDPWLGKRRHARVEAIVPARIEPLDQGEGLVPLSLHTKNISAGGAYFQTLQALPRSTEVKLDIVLPVERLRNAASEKNVLVKMHGTVVRSDLTGMAILFGKDYRVYRIKK